MRDIHRSFYDAGTADKMKARVEVQAIPTAAETQLAAVAAWLLANAVEPPTPMGKDVIRPGVYETLVPVGIDEAGADVDALCAQGVLPLFTPQAVAAGMHCSARSRHPTRRLATCPCHTTRWSIWSATRSASSASNSSKSTMR